MSQKLLIVVSGVTGVQGGSIVNSLLQTGRYRIRGLTRNPSSDKAKALAAKGVEIFKCDLSVEDNVKDALTGADIAWIVTNFWDSKIAETDVGEEERQGKMIAEVAKATGLNWLIYSSLPDTTLESDGKLHDIFHFFGKNYVEQYIKMLGIPNTTFIYLGFYYQNVGKYFVPFSQNDNGEIEVVFPYLEENDQIPMIDAEADTGPIVTKIIEEGPAKWNGKKVPAAAEYVTVKHIVDTLTKATGKTHKLRTVNDDDIKDFPSLDNDELKSTYKWFKTYGFYGKDEEVKDISIAKKLHPNIKTFEQFIFETCKKA